MNNLPSFQGAGKLSSDKKISIRDGVEVRSYYGQFSYSSNGQVTGEVTGIYYANTQTNLQITILVDIPAVKTALLDVDHAQLPDVIMKILTEDDLIYGTQQNDSLTGWGGDDRLVPGSGNDVIDGGSGIDRVEYPAYAPGRFAITKIENGYAITDRTGEFGTDTLINVERVRLSGTNFAIDIDGNAGQVYRLYQAAFDRVPDLGGLGYQINAMDKGLTLQQLASNFIASDEFRIRYGSNLSNGDLVTQMYRNVLHREPEQAGYANWLGALDHGDLTRSEVLCQFSESAENKAQVIGSIQNGIEYTFIP
jgi:hypothetical protein